MIKPAKEGSKSVEEVKIVLKEVIKPEMNGFNVSGVEKERNRSYCI